MNEERADRADKRPASRRIADELRAEIESGGYAVGDRLPSYRDLMARYGVAVNTAQAAVRLLEQEGYAVTKDRSGSHVIERGTKAPAEVQLRELRRELGDLRDQIRDTGGVMSELEQRVTAIVDRLDSGQA